MSLRELWLHGDQLQGDEAPARVADPEPAPAAETARQVPIQGSTEATGTVRQPPSTEAGKSTYHEPPTVFGRHLSGGFDRRCDGA